MAVRIGQMLDGKYRVVRVLGQGGMGAVYEGENTFISRRVAIKVLHADLMKKPDIVSRFEMEAQAAGRIQNDHINEVLDLGTLLDGSRFIVLEFLEGETLKDRVKRAGRLTPMQAVHVVRQVLAGLSAAHRAGIVHRDLKPGNVFILWEKLGQRDFVKIIDFGVSKFLLSRESEALDSSQANAILGTPHYMAPEQLRRSSEVDARADLYSVGIILYKAVTGRVPYHAQTLRELLVKLRTTEPVPASNWVAGLDPTFLRILSKAMARDVSVRFQSADEFLAELDQWRMEMAAADLPYFTEDGLISTMHNVALRRGSSDVSVPPVHVGSPIGDSISLLEVSEVSGPLPTSKNGSASGKHGTEPDSKDTSDATATARAIKPVPSSSRAKLLGVLLAVLVMGGVGGGVWYSTRASTVVVVPAAQNPSPSESSHSDEAGEAVESMPLDPMPTGSEDDIQESSESETVISASDLPEPVVDPSESRPRESTRAEPRVPRDTGKSSQKASKEEKKEPATSEWGY